MRLSYCRPIDTCLCSAIILLAFFQALAANAAEQSVGWHSVPAILKKINPPEFPKRDFPISSYGAIGDGKADATKAIRDAIKAAHDAGGGRVLVDGGTFLTGAVHLLSNVNLHIAKGSTLLFSTDPAMFPIVFTRWEGVECMNYSPLIYAYEQKNIAITGEGILDGGASFENWWSWMDKKGPQPAKQVAARLRLFDQGEKGVPVKERIYGDGSFLRPNFIQFYHCKNILIEGVTILRSPMWEIHPVLSENITVRKVTIRTHGPNNDGFDPESSRDILVEDTLFDTGDDCIAVKSGRNNDGRRIDKPSENIIVRNCTMVDGHGGVVLGSEISGGARNVFVENCVMDSPQLDRALRFKSNAHRGGTVENVFLRNIRIGRVLEAVLTIDFLYEEGPNGPHLPIVRNVSLENVTSTSSPRVMWIDGFPGAIIENIQFENCSFRQVESAEVVNFAKTISFRDVIIEPANKTRSLNSPEVKP